MLKSIVDRLERWGVWLYDKPVYLLPLTLWPLILIYVTLGLIWLWLIATKPLRRAQS
jgi:hypothetical protein